MNPKGPEHPVPSTSPNHIPFATRAPRPLRAPRGSESSARLVMAVAFAVAVFPAFATVVAYGSAVPASVSALTALSLSHTGSSHASTPQVPAGPSPPPQPYHLRWLGPPQAVLGLNNGYRDTMGNLETQGTALYTCYLNYSNGAGGNLDLLSNVTGSWQATPLGTPLTAGTSGGGPGCSVATATWNGKTVSFIAYLATAESATYTHLSNGVNVIYNPSGSLSGPWVNVVAEPPGFHAPGSCCISPASISDTVYNNGTLLLTFAGWPPLWTNQAGASQVWVVGIPLSALPTTPGGSATAPWQVSIPDASDICCGQPPSAPAVDAWIPQILSAHSKLVDTFVRADTTPGGFPQEDIAEYQGTVLGNGNTTWAAMNGSAVPNLESTYESVYTTPVIGGGLSAIMLGSGTTFLGVQNGSSVPSSLGGNGYMSLNAVWGNAPTWQNTTLNEIAPGNAVYDTTGATFGACGATLADEALVDPSASSAQPAVATYNNSQWTFQTIGPVNQSNEVPNFLEVAAQGQYVDAMFLNQPGGGASGWTSFYTAQAICTNSTLSSLSVQAAPASSVAYNASVLLYGQATDLSGAPLYHGNAVTFSWAIRPAGRATLNATTGAVVNLTAASTAGAVTVYMNASQYGWIAHTTFVVNVVHSAPSPSPSPSGSSIPWIPIVVVIVVVVAAASYLGFRMVKGRHPTAPAPGPTSPAPPPSGGPMSPPPPPSP